MDMVVKTTHIPDHGETVLGGSFFMNPGGKGANQAVAVARLGGNAIFVSKMGNDVFGKQAFQLFNEEGINTRFMISDEELPSGVALITVDEKGENSIVVAPGANANLQPIDVEPALKDTKNIGVILLQLEIPIHTVQFAVKEASLAGITVIVNPAPAAVLSQDMLSHIDILTPNRTEASMLSGIEVTTMESAVEAAHAIKKKGVKNVVITMGVMGAVVLDGESCSIIPAVQVQAVDTTAAGDVFNGALAVALSEKRNLESAVQFACEAAAISVTKLGAQSSIPYRNEVIIQKLVNEA